MMRTVVAIRRDARKLAPTNLLEIISELGGVSILAPPLHGRMIIECDDEQLAEIQDLYGQFVHLEREHRYYPVEQGGST